MNKKKAAKGKNNPVYTQQDDSALLESTGTNPRMPTRRKHLIKPAAKGKLTVICQNVHKDAAEKLSKKDDEQDGEAEEVDERDEDRK